MTWLVAFIIALSIWVTVFPLYAFTQHDNKEEAKQTAIEIWKEYNDELIDLLFFKKLARFFKRTRDSIYHANKHHPLGWHTKQGSFS